MEFATLHLAEIVHAHGVHHGPPRDIVEGVQALSVPKACPFLFRRGGRAFKVSILQYRLRPFVFGTAFFGHTVGGPAAAGVGG